MRPEQFKVTKPRKLRLDRGITQDRAALEIGVSRYILHLAEKCPATMSARTARAIAQFYSVDAAELLR